MYELSCRSSPALRLLSALGSLAWKPRGGAACFCSCLAQMRLKPEAAGLNPPPILSQERPLLT